jgi:hypothetical protein
LPKIDNIDLHNTLCSFTLPIEVRDELLRVKEKHHLHYSREEIDIYHAKISDLKKRYAEGGFSSRSSASDLLWEELHILFSFYSSNNILGDEFYTFRAAIAKGLDAILISHTTDKRYEYNYKNFDNLILSLMIFFVEEEALEKMFENNKIDKIPIWQAEKALFLKVLKNFFTFQFSKGIWDSIRFNDDILRQDYFSYYRQELRGIFNRIMIILSKVELTDDELKLLTEPDNRFFKSSRKYKSC